MLWQEQQMLKEAAGDTDFLKACGKANGDPGFYPAGCAVLVKADELVYRCHNCWQWRDTGVGPVLHNASPGGGCTGERRVSRY
jgi:hypothetical protein